MPIDSVNAGANARLIQVVGDPALASNLLNVAQFHLTDGQSLSSGIYSLLSGNVTLLLNAAGTFDRQRSAPGTTGVPSFSSEGVKTTYSAAINGLTPAATATDFWQLIGSGTKTVRLLRLAISGIATSAATVEILAIKRTALNTGGTQVPVTIAQHDSNDAAPTAAVNTYSANPGGVGTSAGLVRAQKLNLGAAGAAGSIVWDFTTRNGKGLVLRGSTQQLVLNWNGAAVPAGTSITVDAEVSEE